MSAGAKCTPNPDLNAAADRFKAKLEKNCDAIIENQKCFYESAQKYNKAIDQIDVVAGFELSNGQTVDEFFNGSLSNLGATKVAGVGKDPYDPESSDSRNAATKGVTAWQVGTDSDGVISRYGSAKFSISGGYEASAGAVENRGQNQSKIAFDQFLADQQRVDEARANGTLTPDDLDLLEMAGVAVADANIATNEPGMTSCAQKSDELEVEMQTALGDTVGVAAAQYGVDGVATAEEAIKQRNPETRTDGGYSVSLDQEIEYNEQCVLLSQIVPLARYHRTLNMEKGGPHQAKLPYLQGHEDNAPMFVDGEAYGFINRLTQSGLYKELFNMKTADIASLQPLIRLYKVIDTEDEKGNTKSVEHEIAFDSFASDEYGDITDIFANKNRRGFGVGIKSFNVSFEGQDMFAATRSIKAKLKIQANSFDELLTSRISKSVAANAEDGTSFKKAAYRYIELALKTGGKDIEKYSSSLNDLNYRLKAVFGWNPHAKNLSSISPKALQESFLSVNLTPVKHYFDFDDQGRVTFTIEYYAYVEELLSKPTYNIFTDSTVFSKILARSIAYKTRELNEACDVGGSTDSKEKADQEKSDNERIESEKLCMMNHLITQLFRDDKIHILKFTREELKRAVTEGPFFNFDIDQVSAAEGAAADSLVADINETWKSYEKDQAKSNSQIEAVLTSPINEHEVQIPYVYAGDIVQSIMGRMTSFLEQTKEFISNTSNYEGMPLDPALKSLEVANLEAMIKQYRKYRLTLGPIELEHHGSGAAIGGSNKYINVNLADIPITVSHFTEFLTAKLLKKDEAIYPLNQFLKDFFNSLIKNYLNTTTCKGADVKQKTRLFESCVTSYGQPTKNIPGGYVDRISYSTVLQMKHLKTGPRLFLQNANYGGPNQSVLNLSGKSQFNMPNPGFDSEFNHFIFYAGRVQPTNLMNGDRAADENRGIFHYLLGKDSGIVKNIQLNRTETPYMAEVRFESEGFKELQQLRVIYDVEIDSYANLRALPGAYLFVDPKGFAPNMAAFDRKEFELTDLGIGGYYMIIRSEHEFAPGVANSRITAVWVHSKEAQDKNKVVEQSGGKNKMVKSKCLTKYKKLGLAELAANTASATKEQVPPASAADTVSSPPEAL
jgi:hypothetical protein